MRAAGAPAWSTACCTRRARSRASSTRTSSSCTTPRSGTAGPGCAWSSFAAGRSAQILATEGAARRTRGRAHRAGPLPGPRGRPRGRSRASRHQGPERHARRRRPRRPDGFRRRPAAERGRARAGSVTGTPLYLAPEVLERGETSARSDIYSLGVLLYHLVTNDYPVRGQTPVELLDAHRQGRVRRLRDAAPKMPVVVRARRRTRNRDRIRGSATRRRGSSRPRSGGRTPTEECGPSPSRRCVAGGSGGGAAGVVTLECARQFDAARGTDASRRGTWCRTSHRRCHLGRDLPGARYGRHTPRHLAGVGGECQARSRSRWRKSPTVSEPPRLRPAPSREQGDQFEVKLRVFLAGSDSPAWAETFMGSSTS